MPTSETVSASITKEIQKNIPINSFPEFAVPANYEADLDKTPTVPSGMELIKHAYEETKQFILDNAADEAELQRRLEILSMPRSHHHCLFCGVLDNNRIPVINKTVEPNLDWLPDDCEVIEETEFREENLRSLKVLLPEGFHTRVSKMRVEHIKDTPFKPCEGMRVRETITHDTGVVTEHLVGMRPTWNPRQTEKQYSAMGGWLSKDIIDMEYRVIHFDIHPNFIINNWDVGRSEFSERIVGLDRQWCFFRNTQMIKPKKVYQPMRSPQ